jgi:hypothetical protein
MTEVLDPAEFNLREYIAKAVTLPEDTVTVYLDAAAAWQYANLMAQEIEIAQERGQRQDAADSQNAAQDSMRTISDPPGAPADFTDLDARYEALQEPKKALAEKLAASGVVFKLRAVSPKVQRLFAKEAKRETNKLRKDKSTEEWDQQDFNEHQNSTFVWKLVAAAIRTVTMPGDRELRGPFTVGDAQEFEDDFDTAQWNKVLELMNDLNSRNVIEAARMDAGFPH